MTVEYPLDKPLKELTKAEINTAVKKLKGNIKGRVSINGYQDKINELRERYDNLEIEEIPNVQTRKNIHKIEGLMEYCITFNNTLSLKRTVDFVYMSIQQGVADQW